MSIFLGSDRSTPNLDQIMTEDVVALRAWADPRIEAGHDVHMQDFGFYMGADSVAELKAQLRSEEA